MTKLPTTKTDYISFDFDDTLYSTSKNELNEDIVSIMQEAIDCGENVCITTLRHQNDCKIIEELFKDIPIYALGGNDKANTLRYSFPVKVKKHYDDDITCCLRLLDSSITPIWIRNKKWDVNYMKIKQIKI